MMPMTALIENERYFNWFHEAFQRAGATDEATRRQLVPLLLDQLQDMLSGMGEAEPVIAREMALARESADRILGPAVTAHPEASDEPAEAVTMTGRLKALLGTWPGRIVAGLLGLLIYLAPLALFVRDGTDVRTFTAANPQTSVIGVTVAGLDFVKDVSQLHLNLLPTGLVGDDGHLPADLILTVDAGSGPVTHTFKGGMHLVPWTVTAAVEEGDILDYPFDRHVIEVSMSATMAGKPVPVAIGLQHVVHGYRGVVTRNAVEGNETEATIEIRRSGTVIFLASLITLSLIVVVGAAVSVAYQVTARKRKPEFSMMVWTGALLFVVPSVRGSLPGAIPTGALIDFAVYFWLQVMMVGVSVSLVRAWTRRTD